MQSIIQILLWQISFTFAMKYKLWSHSVSESPFCRNADGQNIACSFLIFDDPNDTSAPFRILIAKQQHLVPIMNVSNFVTNCFSD